MRVTKQLITAATLTASSVAEPADGEQLYNDTATYAAGDEVISTDTHRVYESLTDANEGNPLPVLPDTATDHWIDVGPTQKFAAFDLDQNTATEAPSPYTFTITPGQRVNTFGAAGVIADECTVVVKKGSDVRSTSTITLRRRRTTGWYSYWTGAFIQTPSFVFHDLAAVSGCTVEVTFTRSAGNVVVASAVLGSFIEVGDVESEAESDARNFSTVERSVYGDAKMNKIKSVPVARQKVMADASLGPGLRIARADLDATNALWTGLKDAADPNFDALAIVGFYTRWNMVLTKDHILQQIDLEAV